LNIRVRKRAVGQRRGERGNGGDRIMVRCRMRGEERGLCHSLSLTERLHIDRFCVSILSGSVINLSVACRASLRVEPEPHSMGGSGNGEKVAWV
jgi:hypothetical protein